MASIPIKISPETKKKLDELRHPGQTYDGILQELIEKEGVTSDLLEACKAQHQAIDRLFAELIERDPAFFPSKSGQPWEAIQKGTAVIKRMEG